MLSLLTVNLTNALLIRAPNRMNEEGRNTGKDCGLIVPAFLPSSFF
jgi:hypothetical protein